MFFKFDYSVNIIKKPEIKKSQANYFAKVINNLLYVNCVDFSKGY